MNAIRVSLALIRLAILFLLLNFTLLGSGLLGREIIESERWLSLQTPVISCAPASALSASCPETPAPGVTLWLSHLSPAQQTRHLNQLKKDGFQWVRLLVDWGEIEPLLGQHQWHELDTLLDSIALAGLSPVVVIDNSPEWARAVSDRPANMVPFAPPTNHGDMARFAAELAARYGDDVRYYQIWNEPNIAPHWGNRHIEPVDYARMLRKVGQSIRQVDPDAIILTAALAPTSDQGHTALDEVSFLMRLYSADRAFQQKEEAGRLFDAVALEPYGFGYTADNPRRARHILNYQRLAWVRRAMMRVGDSHTPIWAARFGWNRIPNGIWGAVSPENQNLFALKAVSIAYEWPWLTHMGWAIDRLPPSEQNPLRGFTLTRPLTKALTTSNHPQATGIPNSLGVGGSIVWIALLLATYCLVGWRSHAAIQLLPLRSIAFRLESCPQRVLLALLAAVGVAYHLATWTPLILLCLLSAAGLFLYHPRLGLGMAAILLPYHFQHKEISIAEWRLAVGPAHAVLLCLAPTLLHRLRRTWPLHVTSVKQWDGLVISWLVLGCLSAVNVWHFAAFVKGLFELVIMPAVLYTGVRLLIDEPEDKTMLAIAVFAGGIIASLIGLFNWYQGSGPVADGLQRLVGPHFSPNHTALYLERALFIGVGIWAIQRLVNTANRLAVTMIWAGIFLIGIAILLTGSRGGLLLGVPAGLFVFAMPFFAVWRRQHIDSPRSWVWLAASTLLVMVIAATTAWMFAGDRLTNSSTMWQRIDAWRASFNLWQDVPLFGTGPGGFTWFYPAYMLDATIQDPNLRHPHNIWLEMATGGGIAALLWLVWLLALCWNRLRITLNSCAKAASAKPETSFPQSISTVSGKTGSFHDLTSMSWLDLGLLAGLAAGLAHSQVDAFGALTDLAALNWLMLSLLAVGGRAINSRGSP